MKRGSFPAELFGKRVASLPMLAPVKAQRAVLMPDCQRIRCGARFVCDPWPVVALCRELKAAGEPDSALVVSWPDGTAAMLVLSIHDTAWSPERMQKVCAKPTKPLKRGN